MKDKVIFVRVSEKDKSYIEEAAKAEGRTVSNFMARAAVFYIGCLKVGYVAKEKPAEPPAA